VKGEVDQGVEQDVAEFSKAGFCQNFCQPKSGACSGRRQYRAKQLDFRIEV